MQRGLVASLRARRVDVLTPLDCGMVGESDEEHLRHATSEGRVLYSFNIKDYSLLHRHWITSGLELHHGDLIQIGDYRIVLQDDAISLHPPHSGASATTDPIKSTLPAPDLQRGTHLLERPDRLVMLTGPKPKV